MGGRAYGKTKNLGLPLHWNDGGMTDGHLHNALALLLDDVIGGQLSWKGPVADFASLPTGTVVGEARVVINEAAVYVWNGSEWRIGNGGVLEASAPGTTTTTGPAADAPLAGMLLTPGAGIYLLTFSTSADHTSTNASTWFSVYVNGVQVVDTEREFRRGGAGGNVKVPVTINKRIIVGDGEDVEIRWRTSAATASAYQRTLNLLKVA
jgi:hypothetical protein